MEKHISALYSPRANDSKGRYYCKLLDRESRNTTVVFAVEWKYLARAIQHNMFI